MNDIELRTCPCCGGKAKSHYYDPYDGYQGNLGRYWICCTECNLRTDEFPSLKKAADNWNERAEKRKDGDIYWNPAFGDLWIVDKDEFIKINDGCRIECDVPEGFVKVGHVDGIMNRFRNDDVAIANPHVDDQNP